MSENKFEETFGSTLTELTSILSDGNYNEEEEALAAISRILALPDEFFDIISEAFLLNLEKQLKDPQIKAQLLATVKMNNYNYKDYPKIVEQANKEIDEELLDLSESRRDFLKRMMNIASNAISDCISEEKNFSIPIELCHPDAKIPTYANDTDAGMDIYAIEEVEILPGETKLIKTGLKVAIPIGYELQVRPKSGRALKTKLRVANTPGTIDSGYRDEIGVIIENIEPPIKNIGYEFDENGTPIIKSILHGEPYIIQKGQKFAQLVLSEVPKVSFFQVDNIKEISGDRHGGFGSTGLK